jgi:hypothetical protein
MPEVIPQILYWKWDRKTLEEKTYRAKIDDICGRSVFTHIYVSPVWSEHEICDPLTVEAFHDAARLFRERDRWLVLDIDVRTARKTYAERYPDHLLWLWQTQEVKLPKKGARVTFKESPSGDHYGTYPVLDSRLVKVFLYKVGRNGNRVPDTLREAGPGEFSATRESKDLCVVDIPGGPEGVTHAFAIVAFQYEYPDIFSPKLVPFLEELVDLYRDAPLGGACLDEWGYPPYPGFGFSRAWKDPWYRSGEDEDAFARNALDVVRPAAGDAVRPDILSIERTKIVRDRCAEIENRFSDKVKGTWGGEAFVGVHPTWHAIDPVQNAPEIWKNGFDWFDVRRDYAQTDEFTPYPVRLALAHKWGDRPFFNMWYTCGSLDIDTYITESWTNARYGGRTHVLGYECPNETDSVMELAPPGLLEKVSKVEEAIALLNRVQESVAHSNVLIVLGTNAAVSPSTNHIDNGKWDLTRGTFVDAFQIAETLWRFGYICDLVPSTEIESGALTVGENGRPGLGRNEYEAVLFVGPEYSSEAALVFLERVCSGSVPLLMVGETARDSAGRDVRARFRKIAGKGSVWNYVPTGMQLDMWLRRKGIRPNELDGGAYFNDGMVVFTSHTRRPSGTPLRIDCEVDGRRVEAEAEDLFAIRLDGEGEVDRLAAGSLSFVRIGGEEALRKDPPEDTVREKSV